MPRAVLLSDVPSLDDLLTFNFERDLKTVRRLLREYLRRHKGRCVYVSVRKLAKGLGYKISNSGAVRTYLCHLIENVKEVDDWILIGKETRYRHYFYYFIFVRKLSKRGVR